MFFQIEAIFLTTQRDSSIQHSAAGRADITAVRTLDDLLAAQLFEAELKCRKSLAFLSNGIKLTLKAE